MDKSYENDMQYPEYMENGDVRGRCGFHCRKCPAYKENIHSDADRSRVHLTWNKIYGLDVPPSVLNCDGCLKPDDEHPVRIGGDCEIRNCVLEKNLAHCGLCADFPCDLMERHLASVETVVPECRSSCSPEEFRDFIEPYLCREFLESEKNK